MPRTGGFRLRVGFVGGALERGEHRMDANRILGNVALLFALAVLWDDLKSGGRLDPKRRTWLLIAGAFSIAAIAGGFFR